jgi:hypothetical protein
MSRENKRPHRIIVKRHGKRWIYEVKAGNHVQVDDSGLDKNGGPKSFVSKWYTIFKAKKAWPTAILVVEDWYED